MAEEEEETFVFVEFTGLPDDKLLKQYKGPCSLLKASGSSEVVMQLDRYTFRGSLEDTVGTNLFFKKSCTGEQMTYFCKGTKKMNLQRVVLKRKREEVTSSGITTTAAKQVKQDSNEVELGSGSPSSPSREAQGETVDATDLSKTHSEPDVCEAVQLEAESTELKDVVGEAEEAESGPQLTGPCEIANLT